MGNSWDSLEKGRIMSLIEWVGITVGLLLFSLGTIKAGQGKNSWIVFPLITFGIYYFLLTNPWLYYESPPENYPSLETLAFYGKVIYGSLSLLFVIAFVFYNLIPSKMRAEQLAP